MRCLWFLLVLSICPTLGHGAVIANGGFEDGTLDPWYIGRELGSNRSWLLGTREPHEGIYDVFSLGRIELRQDFIPVQGADVLELSFFGTHQFPDRGNPWVELFYSDDSTSGFIEIPLDPDHSWQSAGLVTIWDKFDLVPHLEQNKSLTGVSFIGIPDNVFSIDSVVLRTVPEPHSTGLILLGALAWVIRRPRLHESWRR